MEFILLKVQSQSAVEKGRTKSLKLFKKTYASNLVFIPRSVLGSLLRRKFGATVIIWKTSFFEKYVRIYFFERKTLQESYQILKKRKIRKFDHIYAKQSTLLFATWHSERFCLLGGRIAFRISDHNDRDRVFFRFSKIF